MKNLHLIPTDKPSRLCKSKITQKLSMTDVLSFYGDGTYNQHIYITSDEEIKEDDWFTENGINTLLQWRINKWKMSYSFPSEMNDICKKIILTTDQDLIKDGVQAIDDIFLEWFIENPSCEEVFITNDFEQVNQDNPILRGSTNVVHKYKIIIPKEEHILEEAKERAKNYMALKGALEVKKETLEEAAEKWCEKHGCGYGGIISIAFETGAKWQEDRSYSKEDMIAFLDWSKSTNREKSEYVLYCLLKGKHIDSQVLFDMWFEQHKK